jgi:CheY-like chemotaxis protein
MKLDYKILWFDDQPDSARNMMEGISTRLSRLGFTLAVEWNKGVKDTNSFLAGLQKRTDIDLILMDWNMGANSDDGAVLAKKIRSKTYTEIVFYSSASPSELRKAIYDQDIDGVYCVRRETLVAETINVIRTTIKKILDINHMRGLVMGTVSDYDAQIDEMMLRIYQRMADSANFVAHVKKCIMDSSNNSLQQIEKIASSSDPKEILSHRGYTAILKYKTLCNLLNKKSGERAIVDLLAKLNNYQMEIIEPRNALAHASAINENGKITLRGKEIPFDDEMMLALRRDLLAHGDNLNDIEMAINAGIFDDIVDFS